MSLRPHHGATADYVRRMREILPRRFPGVTFSFLPADMVSQILNFGAPAPIDLQIVDMPLAEATFLADRLLRALRQNLPRKSLRRQGSSQRMK